MAAAAARGGAAHPLQVRAGDVHEPAQQLDRRRRRVHQGREGRRERGAEEDGVVFAAGRS